MSEDENKLTPIYFTQYTQNILIYLLATNFMIIGLLQMYIDIAADKETEITSAFKKNQIVLDDLVKMLADQHWKI